MLLYNAVTKLQPLHKHQYPTCGSFCSREGKNAPESGKPEKKKSFSVTDERLQALRKYNLWDSAPLDFGNKRSGRYNYSFHFLFLFHAPVAVRSLRLFYYTARYTGLSFFDYFEFDCHKKWF